MNLVLYRLEYKPTRTLGELCIDDGLRLCATLEPSDRAKQPCIPVGTYELRMTWSPRFKRWLPQVMNVPDRKGIRIHTGNKPADTSGCILVGRRFRDYIINSTEAMDRLLFVLDRHKGEKHTIRIENYIRKL